MSRKNASKCKTLASKFATEKQSKIVVAAKAKMHVKVDNMKSECRR